MSLYKMNFENLLKQDKNVTKKYGYKFTKDWFHGGIQYDINRCVKLDNNRELHLLEIGAFEGKSTVWFNDTYLSHKDSTMTVIDPFLTTDTTTPLDNKTFEYFCHNIKLCKFPNKVKVIKDLSQNVLPELVLKKVEYDLIFIDGSHLRRDIILDIVLSWKILKKNGYMILDDYTNQGGAVKDCVNFWFNCLDENEWVVLFDRYQIIIQKLA